MPQHIHFNNNTSNHYVGQYTYPSSFLEVDFSTTFFSFYGDGQMTRELHVISYVLVSCLVLMEFHATGQK